MELILEESKLFTEFETSKEKFIELLIEQGYQQSINIAIKYQNNEKLSLEEYSRLVEFFNYIDHDKLK